jgi:DNA-binding beta-propeller fold protein YncE
MPLRPSAGLGLCGLAVCVTSVSAGCASGTAGAGSVDSPASDLEYRLYVTNESSDVVSRVVFDPVGGARVEGEIPIGIRPGDIEGPHGISVAPPGDHFYVTVAHGTPDGTVWKFRAGDDVEEGRIALGRFPASSGTTPDGRFLFVVNFNLHGDMVPSDLSVVFTPELREIARIPTCVMPHGSRMNASGSRHYHVCMHSDQLVELSLPSFAVSHRFSLHPGHEMLLDPGDLGEVDAALHDPATMCSPTWVSTGRGAHADRMVYVACNRADRILEIDVESWTVTRRFDTGRAPYNLDVSPDGRLLVATLKGGQAIEVFDLESGESLAHLATSREITHGVEISPDDRYAFVTNESIGGVPGTLDVFDLVRLERVATVELRLQPGGVDLWRVDPRGEGPAPASRP